MERRLNEHLIPSQSPGSPSGFGYAWKDYADLEPGRTYWYRLEVLDIHSATTLHGPVSATVSVPTAVRLRAVSASPAPVAGLPSLWVAAGAGIALGLSRLRRRVSAMK